MHALFIYPYVIGMLLSLIILLEVAFKKRRKVSHADIFYISAIVLLILWQVLDILKLLNTNIIMGDSLMVMRLFSINLMIIMIYMFTIELKREINIMDILLAFPLFLITIFYVFNKPWMMEFFDHTIIYRLVPSTLFYWLSSIIMGVLLCVKTLSVILEWFEDKTIRNRMYNIIAMLFLSLTTAILFDIFIYPHILKVQIGSALVSIIVYASYRVDKKIKMNDKNKNIKMKKEKYPELIAAKRIREFL